MRKVPVTGCSAERRPAAGGAPARPSRGRWSPTYSPIRRMPRSAAYTPGVAVDPRAPETRGRGLWRRALVSHPAQRSGARSRMGNGSASRTRMHRPRSTFSPTTAGSDVSRTPPGSLGRGAGSNRPDAGRAHGQGACRGAQVGRGPVCGERVSADGVEPYSSHAVSPPHNAWACTGYGTCGFRFPNACCPTIGFTSLLPPSGRCSHHQKSPSS